MFTIASLNMDESVLELNIPVKFQHAALLLGKRS